MDTRWVASRPFRQGRTSSYLGGPRLSYLFRHCAGTPCATGSAHGGDRPATRVGRAPGCHGLAWSFGGTKAQQPFGFGNCRRRSDRQRRRDLDRAKRMAYLAGPYMTKTPGELGEQQGEVVLHLRHQTPPSSFAFSARNSSSVSFPSSWRRERVASCEAVDSPAATMV